jgi:hypothetical protein
MVGLDFGDADSTYVIDGTITWSFDRGTHHEPGTAMTFYTNTVTSGPVLTTSSCGQNNINCLPGNQPATPAAPSATGQVGEIQVQQQAQQDHCVFFNGGTLGSRTYEQSVTLDGNNGRGNFKFTWTYTVAPGVANDVDGDIAGVQVSPHTAWTSEVTGGTVDVDFSGAISSESFLKQSSKSKYSFTMLENGLSRARNVTATLQVSDGNGGWTNVGSPINLNNIDTNGDSVPDALAVTSASSDFSYFGNAGVFGNAAVYSALHAPLGGKPANLVSNILTGTSDGSSNIDDFAGNNNDLGAGNVHVAPYASSFPGLTDSGAYRVVISGTIKGNGGSADFPFSIASSLIQIGGC